MKRSRDRIARMLLFAIGVFAIGAGVLGMFGMSQFESRATAVLVGIAAIAGGVSLVRGSRGPNPPVGGGQ